MKCRATTRQNCYLWVYFGHLVLKRIFPIYRIRTARVTKIAWIRKIWFAVQRVRFVFFHWYIYVLSVHSRFTQIWNFWRFCTVMTSRGFKKFQQKIKFPPVGIELATHLNPSNSFKSKVWSSAWNKIHSKDLQSNTYLVKTAVRASYFQISDWRLLYFLLWRYETFWCQYCTKMSQICYLQKARLWGMLIVHGLQKTSKL